MRKINEHKYTGRCNKDGTIYGYENSTAQEYAKEYNYKIALIDEQSVVTTPAVTTSTTTTTSTTVTTTTVISTSEAVTTTTSDDINITVRDAAIIAKYLAISKQEELPDYADYNRDGKVDVRDAAAIARDLAKKLKK